MFQDSFHSRDSFILQIILIQYFLFFPLSSFNLSFLHRTRLWEETEAGCHPSGFDQVLMILLHFFFYLTSFIKNCHNFFKTAFWYFIYAVQLSKALHYFMLGFKTSNFAHTLWMLYDCCFWTVRDPVDINTLRRAAASKGGLLTDELRRKVWPKLLNINVYDLPHRPG